MAGDSNPHHSLLWGSIFFRGCTASRHRDCDERVEGVARPDLLIEAGDWVSRLWFANLGTERDRGHVAEPTPSTRTRAIPEHMGRVLCGGSSINATNWVRLHVNDLAHWAEVTGDRRWGYEHALSIWRRMENWQGAPDARYRGRGGPAWCEPSQNPHPLAPAMLEACRSLGLTVFDDLNGRREESEGGFALMNHIIREGRRVNLARAYLYPVLLKPNVTVLTGTHVDRAVLFDGDRASAVEVVRHDRMIRIEVGREIVMSTGGIDTPKVLLLSGIGDEAALRKLGIAMRVDAPEVGRNFQGHLLHGGCLWESPEEIEHRNSDAEASGFWRSSPSVSVPDMNLVQIELPYAGDVVSNTYAVPANAWALCAGLVAPKSRGRVTLRSANPSDPPRVEASCRIRTMSGAWPARSSCAAASATPRRCARSRSARRSRARPCPATRWTSSPASPRPPSSTRAAPHGRAATRVPSSIPSCGCAACVD